VVIGGALVCPGDVVVAVGDGVIVVPRAKAADVAAHARGILDTDKTGRKKLYETMGLPMDKSVE
jgi:regulator of RNase E activity RraA